VVIGPGAGGVGLPDFHWRAARGFDLDWATHQ
jgi:hypothetical protein